MSNLSVAEFQQVFPDIYERETVEAILEIGKLRLPFVRFKVLWFCSVIDRLRQKNIWLVPVPCKYVDVK